MYWTGTAGNLLQVPGGLVVRGTGRVVATRVRRARAFHERARGLLGSPPLDREEALLIDKGRQVHTIGMAWPIDVCFLDRDDVVLHLVRNMRPGRLTRWVPRSARIVEMRAGGMDDLRVGDQLSVVDLSER